MTDPDVPDRPDQHDRPGPARGVRARFCPSPTGTPHVGLARTALFNWAFARHYGGALVFRIEDTDSARDTAQSYTDLLEMMRWLGLNADEGPEIGGPYGPYRQSERREVYADVAARLLAAGHLYESYSTAEDVAAAHRAAGRDPKLGYDNRDRDPDAASIAAARAAGRPPVLRLRMPERDISFPDLVRGPITFPAGSVPDPVLVRGTGDPLYTLVNPVDDALMRITHVWRGEDLLPSTPRQIALYEALTDIGLTDFTPEFGHLPFVTGEGNRKLSKRDPDSDLFAYRRAGFVAEGMINYLALLGWSLADDRDIFTPAELVAAFDGRRISGNPARFDRRKAEAINSVHLRMLDPGDFAGRLSEYAGSVAGQPLTQQLRTVVLTAAPLVQPRCTLLSDALAMIGFLLVDEADFAVEATAAAKSLVSTAVPLLRAAHAALADVEQWETPELERVLREALVDRLGLKPRVAFTAVRVATTGRTVSPPLYESLVLLGRPATLGRLAAALAVADTAPITG